MLLTMVAWVGLRLPALWPLGLIVVLLVADTIYTFNKVHRFLFPENTDERWKQIVLMILTPTASIRAKDFLLRELFAGFHFLVVARVILDSSQACIFTARVLRELTNPLSTGGSTDKCKAVEWTETEWRTVVWEWAEKEFGNPHKLIGAPEKLAPDCLCYCPRCLTQYMFVRTHCADCPGVVVRPLL